jgi:NosR/NirI family nitrous oxide reductase transcriptional regulator
MEGGRPVVVKADATWLKIWKSRSWEIVAFVIILLFTAVTYANRDWLVRHSSRRDKRWVSIPKYAIWLASIGFIGFGLMAQPSITQVLTWFHSLLFQWKWELFLSDPFIFIFWLFIIVTVFVWGRGLFCGWMCPFGSLSELLYKIGGKVGLKRFQFTPNGALHERLKWLKYGIFWGLLAVSFFSMGLAEKLAEVEPFKTTFLVGLFNRSWPYTLFTASLLGLSIFTERPFCKYLCPLGAALAMPTTFRWFGLKRKQECTTCSACAAGCGSLAIDKQGVIDHRECMLCLDCMILYYDDHACPPLSKERKLREKSGLPLTRINSNGYYIPIHPVPAKGANE